MKTPPYTTALQRARIAELESENQRLHVTIVNLKRRLIAARETHARWLLRQQAWRAERDDLLRRLALPSRTEPSRVALRRWGPEN